MQEGLVSIPGQGTKIPHASGEQSPQATTRERTSWEIDGETVDTVADFILGGSKITADGDCSHQMKRRPYSLEGNL